MESILNFFKSPFVTWFYKVGRDSVLAYVGSVATGQVHFNITTAAVAILSGFVHALEGK